MFLFQLRKRQLEQEVERSRVLQDALHVLAQENHTLEKVVSGKKSPCRSTTDLSASSNTPLDMDQSDESELDDMFYDCDSTHIEYGTIRFILNSFVVWHE